MTNVFSIDQCKLFDDLLASITETFDDQLYIDRKNIINCGSDDPLTILMTEKYKRCNDEYRLKQIKSFTDLYGLDLKFIPNFIYEMTGRTCSYIEYIYDKLFK